MLKKSFLLITIIILALELVVGYQYQYTPNVDPHTRYNPLLDSCYYYYAYGSCTVNTNQCIDVPAGRDNKFIDLGDACNRNEPPTINLSTVKDIAVKERENVVIPVECLDQDPVVISYSGWTNKKDTPTTYKDSGSYTEKVTCTDSFGKKAEATFKITVINKNRPPFFKSIGHQISKN